MTLGIGSGSGPRSSLTITHLKLPPSRPPSFPVTIRLGFSKMAVPVSVDVVLPLLSTCVTVKVIPVGLNLPSTNASVVASLHHVQ